MPAAGLLPQLFGDRAAAVEAYVDLLCTAGVRRGLIGPREPERIWHRHVLNCVAVAPLFGPSGTVCDVGSGAGLPGLVIALARPDLHLTLLEPLQRRVDFLQEAVRLLAAPNVTVLRGRAEHVVGEVRADAVTSRAVARLDVLASWCLPLLVPGGELVALKGAHAQDEVRDCARALAELGVTSVHVETHGGRFVQPPTTVVRLQSPGHPTGREEQPHAWDGSSGRPRLPGAASSGR